MGYSLNVFDDLLAMLDLVHPLMWGLNLSTLYNSIENNNRTFASFELKEPLSTKESIFLKGKINKEVYNCHFSISDINQQNIFTQTFEKGLLMQKDINNVLLNTKNEVLSTAKLKSLFKGSLQTLYTSDVDAK